MKKISLKFLSLILIFTIVFSFLQIFYVKNNVYALSSSYTQYIKSGISAFPESYQIQLAYLKYLHPNWNFKAYYTGIDWNELTSSSTENKCLKNTIYKSTYIDPAALCICGRNGDPGYYCASAKTVNYYLDPRNFLGEATVFQFMDLSDSSSVDRSVVVTAVKGTYLENFVDDIMTAANEAKISPLHVVATIFQEIGKSSSTNLPRAISGTVSGYEGYYNFYNYGATDGNGAVERGLQMAKTLGWNSPRYALIDGAKKALANGYLSKGQINKYFYKFDVVGNEILKESDGSKTYSSEYFFFNQYMTNVQDPSNQAGSLYNMYYDNNILDSNLTFVIPVYNNMPASAVSIPSTLIQNGNSGLVRINTLKEWGVTFRKSPNGTSLGNLTRGTIAYYMGDEGTWSKIKVIKATNYDANNKKWNYEETIGYVAKEYIETLGTQLPDHRSEVDMGNGGLPVVGNNDFKVDGQNIIMTPTVTASDIKKKYSDAVIINSNGSDIANSNDLIGTGNSITINGKRYVAVKKGDVNGDGNINSGDLLKIQKHLLGVSIITEQYIKESADANKDGNINSGDLLKIQKYLLKVSNIEL